MILNGYLKKRKNSPEAEPGASRITSRHREILGLAAHPSLTSRAGWIRNYPRGSYGESPMHSRALDDKLGLLLNHPEMAAWFQSAGNRAAFFLFTSRTVCVPSKSSIGFFVLRGPQSLK
jgi:hypothetical protein